MTMIEARPMQQQQYHHGSNARKYDTEGTVHHTFWFDTLDNDNDESSFVILSPTKVFTVSNW